MTMSKSQDAIKAYEIVKALQKRFVDKLDDLSAKYGENKKFQEVNWLRNNGVYGGGNRFEARDEVLFNTASINVSQVHYDEDLTKSLQSASAISTIIHPKNPNVPSIHIHISLTSFKDGNSYWRIMADLNPSLENMEDKKIFDESLKQISKENYEEGTKQGEKYFFIPALNKHRGVSHFYLENYKSEDKQKDFDFALEFGKKVIDTYINIISNALKTRQTFSVQDIKKQLDYHTLYLFQVLTLDRGTTSGLLIHNENDVGIMGSLPKFVNKKLLISWIENMEEVQKTLLEKIISSIDDNGVINTQTKEKLAQVVRNHYKNNPDALKYQASGTVIPNTVNNHIK
ncbi:coproporphyrinogen III oxidase [Arcobacter suis]|uniref:coproporphyrinogen oxidase n=1 Tax=Arcobacter suis CECT 7833 TaxID=663365 RepID=A0AAD0SRD3_9BACT|nr:coproporphyrinogen III oxidase [Arcobacter suis]AXX90022.1 coproporphyrinogen III oxidase [Arcobacter suis CECT 7833]RWS47155.1 coproporphyrinogen III oxidase [Arcobacter suis]